MKNSILMIISVAFFIVMYGCSNSGNSNGSYNATRTNLEETQQNKDKDKYLETIEFIKSKAVKRATSSDQSYIYTTEITIKNCKIKREHTTTSSNYNRIDIFSVELNKLNPNTITIEDKTVTLHTKGNIEAVSFIEGKAWGKDSYGEEMNMTRSKFWVHCKSTDGARRVAKAFKYLIEYCGGKDEMY